MSVLRSLAAVGVAASISLGFNTGASAAVAVASAAGAGNALTVASDGEVEITFGVSQGTFKRSLFLVREGQDDLFLFDDDTSEGSTVNLGSFAAGTELVFRLAVDAGRRSYDLFTGDAARNPMGFDYARADQLGGMIALVSFEDILNGGDADFDDFVFTLSNALTGDMVTPVPLPGAALFLVTGLGAAFVARRRAA